MRKNILFTVLIATALSACQKQPDIKPTTNPHKIVQPYYLQFELLDLKDSTVQKFTFQHDTVGIYRVDHLHSDTVEEVNERFVFYSDVDSKSALIAISKKFITGNSADTIPVDSVARMYYKGLYQYKYWGDSDPSFRPNVLIRIGNYDYPQTLDSYWSKQENSYFEITDIKQVDRETYLDRDFKKYSEYRMKYRYDITGKFSCILKYSIGGKLAKCTGIFKMQVCSYQPYYRE